MTGNLLQLELPVRIQLVAALWPEQYCSDRYYNYVIAHLLQRKYNFSLARQPLFPLLRNRGEIILSAIAQ